MDLGLDREHPDAGLDALTDGVELRLDLGLIGGRTFVNNASFGAYAEVVQCPAYRDDKRGTTLQMLPELLSGHRGAATGRVHRWRRDDRGTASSTGQQQPLRIGGSGGTGPPSTPGHRIARCRRGHRRQHGPSHGPDTRAPGKRLRPFLAHEVVIDADADEIPVGIDGEAVMLPTPVHCAIRPLALRVRVPRQRPSVPTSVPQIDRTLLLRQALGRPHQAHAGEHSTGRRVRP
jgi:hypothetical protein